MNAQTVVALVIVGTVAAWGVWYVARAYRVWHALHGERIVICPETGQAASVRFDVARAVTGDQGAAAGVPLQSCSRWGERGRCEEPCALAAQAPESAIGALATRWAADRPCVSCGAPLLASEGAGHHFALRDMSGVTREWVDIAADRLPLALTTSLPMCWNCHIADTFRRQHPELVTDREPTATHIRH